jgi:DNA-binding transcriptional ArsR family regulator
MQGMRTLYHPARDDITLSGIFYALSDPIRLKIVAELENTVEEWCGSLDLDIAKSTLSHHFKVLRESGLTRTRIEGTRYFVSLRRDDLEARFPGLLDALLRARSAEETQATSHHVRITSAPATHEM